jgi:triacylglycerol lipase
VRGCHPEGPSGSGPEGSTVPDRTRGFLARGAHGGLGMKKGRSTAVATLVRALVATGCGMTGGRVDAPVDFRLLLEYARRAAAAYDPEDAIRARFGKDHHVVVSSIPHLDVQAFVEIDDAHRVQWIAVRGTANLENVEEDADYDKRFARLLGVPVHHGFVRDAHAVWEFAHPLLREGYETRVTGHSLGGAVACVLEMRLADDGARLGRCVTFGQPKVTNEAGVERYRDLPLLRVVNHDDPVPLLPWETPGAIAGGLYRHFGRELWLTDRGTWEVFAEHEAERYRLSSFVERLGLDNVEEHKMRRYLARLERLAHDHPRS